ncbi:DUF5302 domain-containing protein [Galbitalea sp. SE-J8]|uniref:DUF5302 domain-containing protein n=1 Tax=Galbitalea sp. SE-J8 TaxID=3054952 RepID=UPI00259CEA5F|nr:DUF5302 domain-containing protein [Galbitalea sp. SE-J8]MDM4762587.1 DUF5302 domain-containing protein [Galbitalea sp. SE-J8]
MDDDARPAAEDDVKRKFREALERKKRSQTERAAHLDGDSSVHHTAARAGGKREFRRKSS